MHCSYFSHNNAENLLANSVALSEIEQVFAELPVITWTGKSKNPRCTVAQSLLNAYIRETFKEWDWAKEYNIKKANKYRHFLDFYKEFPQINGAPPLKVGVEVEFGYHSRTDTDIRKCQSAFQKQQLDVGIIVCLTEEESHRAGQGIACYEALIENLADFSETTITCPILAIGLSRENTVVLDLSLSLYETYEELTGSKSSKEKRRTIHALKQGIPVEQIGPKQKNAPVYSCIKTIAC